MMVMQHSRSFSSVRGRTSSISTTTALSSVKATSTTKAAASVDKMSIHFSKSSTVTFGKTRSFKARSPIASKSTAHWLVSSTVWKIISFKEK
jgi:hypothetical protein